MITKGGRQRLRCRFFLCGSTVLATVVFCHAVPGAPGAIDFEGGTALTAWHAGPAARIQVDGRHAKSGDRSLLWVWSQPAAVITFRRAAEFAGLTPPRPRKPGSVLGFWLFSEAPRPSRMFVELLDGDRTVGTGWFALNYRGWRPLGARYEWLGWKPGVRIDAVRFRAPRDVRSGRLWLDFVCFDLRSKGPIADAQQPWAGNPESLAQSESDVFDTHDLARGRPHLPEFVPSDRISADLRAALATVEKRALSKVSFYARLDPGSMEKLRAEFATLGIRRAPDGTINGRPLDLGGFLDKLPDRVPFASWMNVLRKTCTAYHRATARGDARTTAETKRMFLDLCDYLLDQGATEGNRNVSGRYGSYALRYWPPEIVRMRRVLAETGRIRDMALAAGWYCASCLLTEERPRLDTDWLSNGLRNLPAMIMLLPDDGERLQRMRALQRFFNLTLTAPQPVTPDGAVVHHWMHHFAYGSYSMPAAFQIFDMLHDTPFRLSAAVHRRLKTYVVSTAFAACKYTMPPNMNGRAGTPIRYNAAHLARTLARAGTPDGKGRVDRAMAELFLYLNSDPDDLDARRWRAAGLHPRPPTGHRTMNSTVAALHRRKEWLAAMVGMVRFFRGLEIYGWLENNNYARYARNGSLFIISRGAPVSVEASGWRFEGWNWSFWPGATSLVRPSSELFDYYRMYGNSSPMAGGTDLDGDGVWGMDFRGVDVHFRKSAFFFADRITVVTTGITSREPRPAVTTLFQNAIDPRDPPVTVDGRAVTAFPADVVIPPDRSVALLDNKGTGYIVPKGHPPLHIVRRTQEWTYMFRRYLRDPEDDPITRSGTRFKFRHKRRVENEKYYQPTSGRFARAWFEHGVQPENAACFYTVLVGATPARFAKFAASLTRAEAPAPVEVVQQDASAHAVIDRTRHTAAYVLFAENGFRPAGAPDPAHLLLGNGRPCFVMIRRQGQTRLRLSAAASDLDDKKPILLRLRGRWGLDRTEPASTPISAGIEAGATQIELPVHDSMPVRFTLLRSGQNP